mgnify:CR=1 FL=1
MAISSTEYSDLYYDDTNSEYLINSVDGFDKNGFPITKWYRTNDYNEALLIWFKSVYTMAFKESIT